MSYQTIYLSVSARTIQKDLYQEYGHLFPFEHNKQTTKEVILLRNIAQREYVLDSVFDRREVSKKHFANTILSSNG